MTQGVGGRRWNAVETTFVITLLKLHPVRGRVGEIRHQSGGPLRVSPDWVEMVEALSNLQKFGWNHGATFPEWD